MRWQTIAALTRTKAIKNRKRLSNPSKSCSSRTATGSRRSRLRRCYARAWPAAGYELDLSPRFYVNARARAGLLVYRQTHWSEEKKVVIAGDINIGARF